MTLNIEFRDPPPKRRGRIDYPGIRKVLRDHPGEWAALRKYKSSVSLRLWREGLGPDFEVTSRPREDGDGSEVFAKYIVEDEDDASEDDASEDDASEDDDF